jgi:hypothetical protein
MRIGNVVDIVNWAPVRRSSMSEFAARPAQRLDDDEVAALRTGLVAAGVL